MDTGSRVPVALGLNTELIGTDEVIIDRLRRYRDTGITTLRVKPASDEPDRVHGARAQHPAETYVQARM